MARSHFGHKYYGGFRNFGVPYWGDPTIWGTMFGIPYFRKPMRKKGTGDGIRARPFEDAFCGVAGHFMGLATKPPKLPDSAQSRCSLPSGRSAPHSWHLMDALGRTRCDRCQRQLQAPISPLLIPQGCSSSLDWVLAPDPCERGLQGNSTTCSAFGNNFVTKDGELRPMRPATSRLRSKRSGFHAPCASSGP